MTNPAALIRSIRIALENIRDGDSFRAEVRRLIAEHDTPSLFGDDDVRRYAEQPGLRAGADAALRSIEAARADGRLGPRPGTEPEPPAWPTLQGEPLPIGFDLDKSPDRIREPLLLRSPARPLAWDLYMPPGCTVYPHRMSAEPDPLKPFCSPVYGATEAQQIESMREFLIANDGRISRYYVMSENVARAVGLRWPCTGEYWEKAENPRSD